MKIYAHTPVLLQEILANLPSIKIKTLIDCTLGLGGHLKTLIQNLCSDVQVLAFDQDQNNLSVAKERLIDYSSSIHFINDNFQNLVKYARKYNFDKVDLILLDLGLSSPQVDQASRGFSFSQDGPLDMRFNKNQNLTAADILNQYSEKQLAAILWRYGEIKKANKLAQTIYRVRNIKPVTTTLDLAAILKDFFPENQLKKALPCVFQAFRIAVNDELRVLKEVLPSAIDLLKPGGRIMVISYHSLEDRIVKETFKYFSADCHCDKNNPVCICHFQPSIKIITKKPITPAPEEIIKNPRGRSAKLRIAEKLELKN
jgi:16S rRNA (cytosine1402-N4)-methyltransferase